MSPVIDCTVLYQQVQSFQVTELPFSPNSSLHTAITPVIIALEQNSIGVSRAKCHWNLREVHLLQIYHNHMSDCNVHTGPETLKCQ